MTHVTLEFPVVARPAVTQTAEMQAHVRRTFSPSRLCAAIES